MNDLKPARWRYELLFGLLAAALLALGGRVIQLQYGKGSDRLAARAEFQQRRVIVLPARPGDILAHTRAGYLTLATSRQVPSCYADPELIGRENLPEAAEKVAAAAGASAPELLKKLTARRRVCLMRGLTEGQALAVGRLALDGVDITCERQGDGGEVPGHSVLVCYADPEAIRPERLAQSAEQLARASGLPADQLLQRLKEPPGRQFTWLLRDLSESQAQAIRQLALKGVEIAYEWRRNYPNGTLAAQVLGYRRVDGVAGEGTELYADRWLSARDGSKLLRADAARRGTYSLLDRLIPPEDGRHVVLTLDAVVQGFLEQALAEAAEQFQAKAVMGVVVEPRTGAVLAMASYPSYDPNHYPGAYQDERRNRAITDPYEPGSAFKTFVAIGAVGLEKATLQSSFFCCYGVYHAPRGGTIRDFPGEHFGLIPLYEIIVHSSNIGMARLGETLGNQTLYDIVRAFGFGERTGVDLPGESPGMLLPLRDRRGRPVWTSYDTLRLPFGQGPVAVTALQMASAFSAIANGGVLMRPRVIDRVLDTDGRVVYQSRPTRVRRVLHPGVTRSFIDQALVQVVQRGTGKKARLDQWTVFGKTGTGQIGGPGGYEDRAYTGTFVGGAPASDPEVVCVISVYRPDYAKGYAGGTVAAPYVRQVLGKTLAYLDVPAERPPAGGLGLETAAAGPNW